MSIYRTAGYVLLGYAAWSVWKAERRRQTTLALPASAPAPESRWEGEGGALPVSDAQLAPDPWHAAEAPQSKSKAETHE